MIFFCSLKCNIYFFLYEVKIIFMNGVILKCGGKCVDYGLASKKVIESESINRQQMVLKYNASPKQAYQVFY